MWQNFSFEAHGQQRLQTHFRQATAFSLFGLHDELTVDSIHFKPQTNRAENQGSAPVHSAITAALETILSGFCVQSRSPKSTFNWHKAIRQNVNIITEIQLWLSNSMAESGSSLLILTLSPLDINMLPRDNNLPANKILSTCQNPFSTKF